MHCFTYGTLMCPDIMARMSGRSWPSTPARLTGYRRFAVRGEDYPGIRPVSLGPAHVDGVLYLDLDDAALARLDAFEGEQYLRCRVTVETTGPAYDPRQFMTAEAYVFRPSFGAMLSPQPWDLASFNMDGKARFLARYGTGQQVRPNRPARP